MAFESLSNRLNKAFKNVTGQGKLSEKNMNEMLREVRMSLLEADVNYAVVKEFIENIKEKAMGQEVISSLNPGQMVVKIVKDELVNLLGEKQAPLNYDAQFTTVMMVGLQGTGKTTSAAKIANLIKKKQGKKPLLVACDLVRPAAVEQLKTLGKQINVEVFSLGLEVTPVQTASEALTYAKANGYDVVIFDTAGRLHIDEALMDELVDIKAIVKPQEILLTVDAMTGQDIVNVARSFNDKLSVTGLVLNKIDGDSRGGGILSVRAVTKVPVKFVGQGEKISDLDFFYPERMADRILGMGDILTLVEQAQENIDQDVAANAAERMMSGKFTLEDMLVQMQQVKKMGPLGSIMKMVPGMNQMADSVDDEKVGAQMKKNEAIILSMTIEERQNPNLLRASRKHRIAKGAGVQVSDVNRLISQFDKTKQAMKQMSKMMTSGKMPNFGGMGGKKPMMPMGFGKRKF